MNTREEQIELVKKLLKTGVSDDARMVLEKQFPEVLESEDERIRKHIIDIVRENAEAKSIPWDVEFAWLEKQKEQKPAEWNIKNAKVGDIIYTSSTACSEIFIFKEIENGLVRCFCSYDSEDGFCTRNTHYIGRETDNYKIATVQQCIKLFYIIAKNGYLWNPYKKDLIKNANSAEWSEEDERMRRMTIECLDYVSCQSKIAVVNWLKSLRPHPHWKPSEEQMLTLCCACRKVTKQDAECLDSLYNDLKELM